MTAPLPSMTRAVSKVFFNVSARVVCPGPKFGELLRSAVVFCLSRPVLRVQPSVFCEPPSGDFLLGHRWRLLSGLRVSVLEGLPSSVRGLSSSVIMPTRCCCDAERGGSTHTFGLVKLASAMMH